MSTSALAKKLGIKPGNRVLVVNPPDGYIEQLGELPKEVRLVEEADSPADVVHVFVSTRAELAEKASSIVAAVHPGGVLWISYPKVAAGRSDLSRETMWSALEPLGWRPVSQVAVDDTWSALRFRPIADVKSKRS